MEDNNLEEQKKQQEKQEAGKKTAHVAGKAAATYFGGGVGGALYNAASSTEVGKKIEQAAGNAIQKIPVVNKATEDLNKSGALDAADKGLDLANGNSSETLNQGQKGLKKQPDIQSAANDGKSDSKDKSSNVSDKDTTSENNSNDFFSLFGSTNKSKKIKLAIISAAVSIFIILCIFILSIASILYPLNVAKEFVEGVINGIANFFTKDQQKLEQEFYQELKDVQQEFHNNDNYNVCIDVNLITASLTVNQTFDKVIEGSDEVDENGEDFIDSEGNKKTVPYTKMKKQIRLLARMQMMTNNYELEYIDGSYCSETEQISLIKEGSKNSSTPELIASHDMDGFQAFFTSKVNEEQNNAYYIYHPPFASDGTCSKNYAESMLPKNKVELSIGDFDSATESVFYWNLVNSFIPSYYKDYISSTEPQRTIDIKKIADDIYLLYKQLGPSQTCAVSYAGPSSLCPNGITIEGTGTIDLEEYIAGVVSNEAYSSEGMEALKAQAVAARTYALNYTNYCSNVIPNSTAAQTFTKNINDRAREAVNTTRGEVLVNLDGKVFSAMYDSFCYDDNDCPDSKKNSDGTYTVTYTKMPYGEKHIITLSDPKQQSRINPKHGHAHGMSQLVSYELAKSGMNYREILSYFYSDGVEISLVLSPTTTDGSEIIKGPITNYIASIDSFNQMIYDQVVKSGVGTRSGVVAAATTLVSGFYSQTGYKLPYELIPSGKYEGYGIDPKWGTNTGNANYPLNGLDCSGFISWAIHNGGFAYQIKSANDWGNSGNKRNWSKGTTDDTAKPGDLIFNKPASANGTTGHIRMIIGVNNDGYVVAEASSGKNGVRIMNISFTSTGPYYLVDMSNYYATATKVNDYPG